MSQQTERHTDLVIRWSRRNLYVALVIVLIFGLSAIALTLFPGTDGGNIAGNSMRLLPVFIVIAIVGLRSSAKNLDTDPTHPTMKAIQEDELRKSSVNYAFRNGFGGMLLVQLILGVWLTFTSVANPVALMAEISTLMGVTCVLVSLLYYDR